MATAHQPDPAGRPASTASHRPAAGASSVVPLAPAPNTDDAPTVITSPDADPGLPPVVAGAKLGHFELIEAVGHGGMAAVLKARDLDLGRVVALKILPPAMARDPENVVRFKQEARAAARLDHDNVARVFFCGEDRGQHFIAFEFVDGENLRVLIDRRGTIPAAECVGYMAQVAAGLAHAADRGVVHRDVKPSNIVVTPAGRAKLVDMGLARSLAGQSVNGGVTRSGVTLGTFDYISPEQALDPRRADVRSDLYSLGCAFYHALTGRPPVPDGTAAKKLHAHQHEPVTDPRVLNPAVPDDLAAVLAGLMAKDPDRRYQTPAELTADLAVVAARLNVPLDGGPPAPLAARLAADPPRVPLGWVAAAAAAVVAVAVFAGSNAPGPAWTDAPVPPDPRPAPLVRLPDPPPGSPAAPPATARPATADELAQALAAPGVTEVRLTKGKTYDLAALGHGVVIDRSVTVVGVAGPDAPVVRVAVGGGDGDPAGRPGTLTVRRSEMVKFEGVRFKLADAVGADDQTAAPAGLVVAGAKQVVLDGCWFEAPDLGAASAAGLAVAGPTELTITHCYFDVRRAVGVRLNGRVSAKIGETGFAPHQSAVELEADDDGPGQVRLTHCTFLLDARGAAVRADDGGKWDVTAGACVFAGPPPSAEADMTMMTTDPGEHRPAVFRVEADRPGADAKFVGRAGEANAYYRVAPLVVGGGGSARGYSFDDARQFDSVPAADMAAVELTQSPWEMADPVKELARSDPWRALRLRTTFRRVQLGPPALLMGARFVPRRDGLEMYDAWPPKLGADAAANPREKVWWPLAEGRLGRNEFESLDQAVAALKPGDTLLIRHDGPLAVPAVSFDRMRSPVTVRPHPESVKLVLTPPPGGRPEAGIFRVTDGDLTLEKLEFRGRAAAEVAGGRCALRGCVVTLPDDPAGRSAGVVVADPADGPGRRPHVIIENCLIRGRGAGVWVPAARPFTLEVTNSVVAVAGPLVGVGPPTRPPPADDPARVAIDRVTAVLAGPVVELHPGRGPGAWVPVEVSAGRCVFSAPDPKRPAPVVSVAPALDPPDPSRYVKWTVAGGPNWYDRPAESAFLELVPADDAVEPATESAAGWQKFAGEKAVGAVTFRFPPPAVADLAAATADRLRVTEGISGADPADAGADATRVARPAEE
jgi:hypothetical protein